MSEPGYRPGFGVEEQRNSPFVLVAIFGVVLVGVLAIALVGRAFSGGFTTVLPGVAVAEGGKVVPLEQRAKAALEENAGNRLMDPGSALDDVACELPRLVTDPAGLDAYYRDALACLDQAWTAPLRAAGKPARSPKLTVEDSAVGKCGFAPDEEDAVAFYCDRDEVISMPRTRLVTDAGDDAGIHLAVLAHEYGHHVQALSGILGTAERRERDADESEVLELSRRVELQANCFAGLFLAAAQDRGDISAELAQEAIDGFAYVDDSDSHGSADNQHSWAKAGYEGETTADCDTWSAPPSEIS
ncbi:neutral zinc metallopeptidase [Actinokineospora sp. 24-640]